MVSLVSMPGYFMRARSLSTAFAYLRPVRPASPVKHRDEYAS